MRRVQAGAARSVGFPSLRAAWRLLQAASILGAPLAHGDATLPTPRSAQDGRGAPATTVRNPPRVNGHAAIVTPPRAPGPEKPPAPAPDAGAPRHLAGKARVVRPPAAPDGGSARLLLLHPHAPDEPCFVEDAPPSRIA